MGMTIQIRQTAVMWDDNGAATSAQVHFVGFNQERTININGFVPLPMEEFDGKTFAELTGFVRQHLADKLTEGLSE